MDLKSLVNVMYKILYIEHKNFYIEKKEEFLGIKYSKDDRYFIFVIRKLSDTGAIKLGYRTKINELNKIEIDISNVDPSIVYEYIKIIIQFSIDNKPSVIESKEMTKKDQSVSKKRIKQSKEPANLTLCESKPNINEKVSYVETGNEYVTPNKSVSIMNVNTQEIETYHTIKLEKHIEYRFANVFYENALYKKELVTEGVIDVLNNEISCDSDFYKKIEKHRVGYKFLYRGDLLEIINICNYKKSV